MSASIPQPPPPKPAPTIRIRTAWFARLAAMALIVATPVVTWWLIGPNPGNEVAGIDPYNYDYMYRPPVIDPTVERAVGVAAIVVVFGATFALVVATRSRRIDPRWWFAIVAMGAAGVVVAIAERVMTAAVIGANIGGGLMVLFGAPVVFVLVMGSLGMTIVFLRKTRVGDDA